MLRPVICMLFRTAVLFAATASLARAHHVMGYATPATVLDGLLSGLGHPIIGIDHLLFILGAGVLAARSARGHLLPLAFVVASVTAAGLRYAGVDAGLSELWIAGSLVILGAILLATQVLSGSVIAVLFLVAGALHGYALAEAIVGSERTPLVAYLAGLTLTQSAIALAAWWITGWLALHRPQVPVQRLAGAAIGAAGLAFSAMAAFN